ncbi:MAG: serine hydrolase [Tumebacillaceae bacterium]
MSWIAAAITAGIEAGLFPGAVVHVQRGGKTLLYEAFGHAELVPHRRLMQKEFRFDVASLTKVMATLPAVLRSVQAGKLDLHRPIGDYLPSWQRDEPVTLFHLLTHTSGLPAWRPFYLKASSRRDVLEMICAEPLENPMGTKVVYSDPGLMLTGFVLEEVWGKRLDEVCADLVFRPLGLEQTGYRPQRPLLEVVATEVGNSFERQMCLDAADLQDVERLPWRTETICGEVHDGNAHYGLDGVSGHAGLFSTAEDVARYLDVWRGEGDFFDPRLRQLATTNQTPALNIARTLGFEAAPTPGTVQGEAGCSAGPGAGDGAFGHTGFTGTSMWYDPGSQTGVVLLTNRVHPAVKEGMPAWRRELHATAFREGESAGEDRNRTRL